MKNALHPIDDFAEIAQLIAAARQRAVQAVNITLIDLYWQIGQRISTRLPRQNGAMVWWHNWQSIWQERSLGCADLLAPISSACGSSMKRMRATKLGYPDSPVDVRG